MARRVAGLLCAALLTAPVARAADWVAFRWTGPHAFPHAAVLLPARVDGMDCYVQLDTGANGRFIPAGRADATDTPAREVTVSVAGHSVKASVPQVLLVALSSDGHRRAGTVGNGFFENGTLTLDLRHARVSYSDDALLRDDSDAAPITYVRHEGWEGGHITVPITLPGEPQQQALFDTGAALFTFAPLRQSLYEALRSAESRPLTASSWGEDIGCDISPLTTPLRVSQYTLDSGVLGHCRKAVDIGVPIAGIVGLGGFADRTITIDYPSRKWKVTR
ncbi:hypothetical protein FHW58_004258 [Duganella sp. 1224]|uniref:hypothetical protein n=1 Tax=Duganella sp. 1224 TaxID=2587052 RepID=UPI0015CEA6D2|nr:hypothetical protein [Duganella sp. 1224]NYE63036.1 hypothetical protein [Duganella sp. 1224]